MADTQPMAIRLSDEERDALKSAGAREDRTSAAMARILIVRGLRDMGLLDRPQDAAKRKTARAAKEKK